MDAAFTQRGDAILPPCRTGLRDLTRASGERYLYVIKYVDGGIKAGVAVHPNSRMTTHLQAAAFHGNPAVFVWISVPHSNFASNEDAVRRFCAQRASRMFGAEYFHGVALEPVLDFLATLAAESQQPKRADLLEAILTAPPARLHAIPQVAEATGIETHLLHQRARTKRLPHRMVMNRRYMTGDDVRALLGDIESAA